MLLECDADVSEVSTLDAKAVGIEAITVPVLCHTLLLDNPDIVKHNPHNLLDMIEACKRTMEMK